MTVVSASEPLDRQLSFKSFSVPSGPVCGFHTWFYFFFLSREQVEAMPCISQADLKLAT